MNIRLIDSALPMIDVSSLMFSVLGFLFSLSWPFFLVAWLPVLLVAASKRTDGVEKLGWAASLVFFSWFGYLLFLFAVTLRGDREHRARD